MKDIVWKGDSLKILRNFPKSIRQDFGSDLFRLQNGLQAKDGKPFIGLKRQTFELRTRDNAGIYRILYVTFFKDKLVVLHCFQKKTQKTAKKDVEIANLRLKNLALP